MKIIITGANGQLGQELQRTAPHKPFHIIPLKKNDLDITSFTQIKKILKDLKPDFIINTAAYTQVDQAEIEKEKAFAVNRDGAENLALACKETNSRLIHLSTDFVFDGKKSEPYLPSDNTNPLSTYGKSKKEGEIRILEIHGANSAIIRTAWVYSTFGNNFVKTILRLLKEKEELSIVSDQIGTPTWAYDLAKAIWNYIQNFMGNKILHWTHAGVASWYDFAVAIQEEAIKLNLFSKEKKISPITTKDYPTPATRPQYSVLDKTEGWNLTGGTPQHWRFALREMLSQ